MRPPTLESRTVAPSSAVVESANATDRPPGVTIQGNARSGVRERCHLRQLLPE